MSEELKAQLINLGFHPKHVEYALSQFPGIEDANPVAEWLLMNPETDDEKKQFFLQDIMEKGFSQHDAEEALARIGGVYDLSLALSFLSDRDILLEKQLQKQRDKEMEVEYKREYIRKNSSVEEEKKIEVTRFVYPFVRFGGKIALQNVATSKFLFSERGKTSIFATVTEEDEPDCLFEVSNATDGKNNTGKVYRKGIIPIGLKASDGNWIAAEIDGRVNTNRSGPVGLFASWKMQVIAKEDVDDTSEELKHLDIVTLESALHNLLHVREDVNNDEVVAVLKASAVPPKHAQWRVYIKRVDDGAVDSAEQSIQRRKSTSTLWKIVRSNYRLAALKMRNEEVKQFQDEVEKQRRRILSNSEVQVEECIICWSNPRNTVLLECGHICICIECTAAIQLDDADHGCPICRKKVSRIIHIKE